mmetsp:Transcript_15882/g.43191  ORF Transcript_15882/g.43191 Transcript_15882/m.43191 type:complete len:385 (+) Transcript_15882:461-1615(+)
MGQVANNRRGLASASHVASVVHWRLRRALVVRVEVVGAHDLGIAVGVREHEDGGQLVDLPLTVGEVGAAPLGVVVVQEDHRICAGHEAPGGAKGVEILELALLEEVRGEDARIAKLGDLAELEVLVHTHGLPIARDDLLEAEEVPVDLGQELRELVVVHVLGAVNAEARHAKVGDVVEVGGHGLLDVVAGRAEVREAVEVAVLDVVRILVVRDAAIAACVAAVVHVVGRVDRRRAVPVGAPGHAGPAARRDVVEDGVDVDVHAGSLAALHHVDKGALVARAAHELVGHRLVARPPGVPLDVLVGRRDLHRFETLGTEPLLALEGDVRPGPLEEVHKGGAHPLGVLRDVPAPRLQRRGSGRQGRRRPHHRKLHAQPWHPVQGFQR